MASLEEIWSLEHSAKSPGLPAPSQAPSSEGNWELVSSSIEMPKLTARGPGASSERGGGGTAL
jgi:hypothetical protein